MSGLEGLAQRYAQQLLQGLGVRVETPAREQHPVLAWAQSGLLDRHNPQPSPTAVASAADGALAALQALSGKPAALMALAGGAELLGERRSMGAAPAEPHCRLLAVADGVLAVNLAREDDWQLLPAWLEAPAPKGQDWHWLTRELAPRTAVPLLGRARELGLAVALSAPPPVTAPEWCTFKKLGVAASASCRAPKVLDLSALWAGPLCGRLLQLAGAEVVKVESLSRPDGARRGRTGFYDQLNAGKASVALDFGSAEGCAQLRALIDAADIVIEASRPRALRQLGIFAEQLVAARPGLSWVSITGYGREPGVENALAYGDDAAVAAGLSWVQHAAWGTQELVGDAIADPLTGLHAALASLALHQQGGGVLASLSLCNVVGAAIGFEAPAAGEPWRARAHQWAAVVRDHSWPESVQAPRAAETAASLGADSAKLLQRWCGSRPK